MKFISMLPTGVLALFMYIFGVMDKHLEFYAVLFVLDFMALILECIILRKPIKQVLAVDGLALKGFTIIFIAMANAADRYLGTEAIRMSTCIIASGIEATSIFKHAKNAGYKHLKKFLAIFGDFTNAEDINNE